MTTHQYRGFSYTPTTTTPDRAPMPMVYRGVTHDGIAPEPTRNQGAELVYRGIPYVRDANGMVVVLDEATHGPIGRTVNAT